MMIVLYRIYQICFALPVLIVLTIITALITAAGSIFINGRWWGYYPAHYWAKMWCILMFVRVKVTGRENITKGRSYVFIANHQGAYDIFSIYGYLNHNFKWMMKVGLRRIPFVGYA
ncbi:MAG: 1-acyl-sn-glycerol-3-phosphate acyltransferase, partial [Bacteroidales bacterium]|nr:1-acyl-sn-glycerol-3-phosphate acyltransferase [Bacteroidales bacterium]